jgi:prepilin-type N-terminal cleavage/methylation domain-containing protein
MLAFVRVPAPCRPPRRSGFTLIELVTALVVIGVVAGIAVPRFTGWVRVTRVDSMAAEFVTDVSYARMVAVRSGRRTQLRVDAAARRHEIFRANPDGSWHPVRTVSWSQTPGASFGPTATLDFDTRGLMVTGPVTFTATVGTLSRTVQVLPSGRAYRQ